MRPLLKEEEKRKEKFWRRHTYVRTKWCLCPYKKFWQKNTTNPQVNGVSQTHWNPTLIKNTKKTKTPTNNARKKKMVRPQWWKVAFSALTRCEGSPPGGNALAVLYRRYCVELNVYDGWYISRARAGRTFFCSYFFCILGEGFISVGFENYVKSGFCGTLLPKKTRFSKKRAKI